MTHKYFPTLIIGAGGTGIKTLRFIQSLADSGLDRDLQEMLELGSLQLIGIDTDPKSNENERILDQRMVETTSDGRPSDDKLPYRLSKLPRNWIHLDRTALNHAVSRVHESTGIRQLEDETEQVEYPLESIRAWFPLRNEKTKDAITLGHSKNAGAAQWRPLGRMALFLNAPTVFESIQKVYKSVQQANLAQGPVRAFVISSLAGGTGSGMFWDLAIFLQMIDPSTQTSGMFLLGDPFESVDEGGRIFPNIYASLKEMATYKNWRRDLTVKYPIGKGRTFKGRALGPRAFDMIYLYQSFLPGHGVADRATATIDVTCFRMAQNLLAMSRRDLHGILDVGANNMDSDTTAMTSMREATFCFSTTGTTIFHLNNAAEIEHEARYQLLQEIKPERHEKDPAFSSGDLVSAVGLNKADPNPSLNQVRQELLDKTKQTRPEIIDRYLAEVRDARDYQKHNPDASTASIKKRLNHALVSALEDAVDLKSSEVAIGNVRPLYEANFNARLDEISSAIKQQLQQMQHDRKLLTQDTRVLINGWLKELEHALPKEQANDEIRIKLPKSFETIKDVQESGLGKMKPGRVMAAKIFFALNGKDANETVRRSVVGKVLSSLEESLERFSLSERSGIESILNQSWNSRRETWAKQLQTMLDLDLVNRKLLEAQLKENQNIMEVFARYRAPAKEPEQDQLQELLRMCIPPVATKVRREDWVEDHLRELWPKMEETLNQDTAREQRRELDRNHIRRYLDELGTAYEQQELNKPKNLDLKPMIQFIKKCLAAPKIERLEVAQAIISQADKLTHAVVQYWNSRGNLLMQQAGGENGLRDRMQRCRSKLFSSGIVENKLNKRHLIVMPFGPDSEALPEKEQIKVRETFDILAQEVMHTRSTVETNPTDSPIIFFNDLFRSAEEISRIRDYFNAYETFGANGNTTFYHIDKCMSDLPDIVGNAIEINPVYCGNQDCNFNLRNARRSERTCPGCRKPIWNRCGNNDCSQNELLDLLKGQDGDDGKPRVPYDCPACGGELKTYWWRCPDESHNRKIPTDKEHCPECLVEYQRGDRVHDKVQQRPDLRSLSCPGCLRHENDPKHQIKVPWNLKTYYEKGVNGHDTIVFRRLIEQAPKQESMKIGKHLCPNSFQEHFLFPTCPKGRDNPDERHHLYQNEGGHFGCTRHPRLRFYQCHYCNFPIEENDNRSAGCPRCTRPVRKCDYCSDTRMALYEPIGGTDPERCPNCNNLMTAEKDMHPEIMEKDLHEAAFCANIYGCKAGSDIWHTASEYDQGICKVCPEDASPLFPRQDLLTTVESCPLCAMVLSPLKYNNRERWISGQTIANSFEHKSQHELEDPCQICGSEPRTILKWMDRDGVLSMKEHPRAQVNRNDNYEKPDTTTYQFPAIALERVSEAKLPDISFLEAVNILTTMNQNLDDKDVFNAIKKTTTSRELMSWNLRDYETLLRVFPDASNFTRVIRKRMIKLWALINDLKERKNMWLSNHKEQ